MVSGSAVIGPTNSPTLKKNHRTDTVMFTSPVRLLSCCQQAEVSPDSDAIDTDGKKMVFSRLPGLCGRLKRRRVTILVQPTHLLMMSTMETHTRHHPSVCLSFVSVQPGEVLLARAESWAGSDRSVWTGVSLSTWIQVFPLLRPQSVT